MTVVFADAFYFLARLNRRDQHPQRVIEFSRTFRAPLLTRDWVLIEVADALANQIAARESRTSFFTFDVRPPAR